MPFSARDVAAELRARLPELPIKKLHKLLYYCQAHHLADTGRPLFSDRISAWDMGPVVGALWWAEQEQAADSPPPKALDNSAKSTVGYVLSRYGSLSGLALEQLSHSEDPWLRADASREPGGSSRIDQAWIQEYFARPDVRASVGLPAMEQPELRRLLAPARQQHAETGVPDTREAIEARLSTRAR